MFDHLVQFEPEAPPPGAVTPLVKAEPDAILAAQVETADWLKGLGAPDDEEVTAMASADAAREAFGSLTTAAPDNDKREALVRLKTPEAVRHLVGMLTAYDWEFVQQAKELRGYTVAKLVEETQNPNANIRLKALGLLGKVTEVGLFTDKIEVKKTDLTEAEIDAKLKEKLAKFMDVSDAEIVDIEAKPQTESNVEPDHSDAD